jgi:endonuclease/exonuclease/phosphatase (EEP) superfamily protein YafD
MTVAEPDERSMPTFRGMTCNILFGGVGREQLIRDVVAAVHPDVVVFTEVTSTDALEAIADVVGPYRAGGASRFDREHPEIVSRWPIIRSDLHGPPWAPHKWIEATLQPFGGPRVDIVGVQLVPQPLWPFEIWRRAEVRSLLKRLGTHAGTRQVVAGDFNTFMTGDTLRRAGAPVWVRAPWALQGSWPRWALRELTAAGYTDCYRACHEREPGFTVPAWDPGVRIDYVFASPPLKLLLRAAGTFESSAPEGSASVSPRRSLFELLGWKAVRFPGHEASDHLPVWADFDWSSADGGRSTLVAS